MALPVSWTSSSSSSCSMFILPDPLSCSLFPPLLSSPAPAMSSSSAFVFPASDDAVVAVRAGTISVRRGSSTTENLAAMESDLVSLLESKPGHQLMDSSRRGGAANKGKRHAGEAVLRRKLANEAFLVRVGGGSGGGAKSCRRRGRSVLSEMVADQLAPSVPYSLNRRGRWAQSGTDWLAELAGGWTGARQGRRVRLCLAETDYSLSTGSGAEAVRALHRLEQDREGGGCWRQDTRVAKSTRGALLNDLAKQQQQDEGEDDGGENTEPEEMHFYLSRPHPVAKVFATKYCKRRQNVRSAKRSAIECSGPSTGAGANNCTTTAASKMPRAPAAISTESEPEEEGASGTNELLAQYKPRRQTYSLADFIKSCESGQAQQNSASGGRRAQRESAAISQQELAEEEDSEFAIVPEQECVPLPDDYLDQLQEEEEQCAREREAKTAAGAQRPTNQRGYCPAPVKWLRLQLTKQRQQQNSQQILRLPLPMTGHSVQMLEELAGRREDWRPEWLGQGLLKLDFSWILANSGNGKEPDEPMFIMVLTGDELLANALFQLDTEAIANIMGNRTAAGELEQLIQAIVDTQRASYAQWSAENEFSRHRRCASTAVLEPLRSVFHSVRLAQLTQPLSVYAVLAEQRAELRREEESQFVGAEELLGGQQKSEEEEDGLTEFELIDMHELLSQPASSPQVAEESVPVVCAQKCGRGQSAVPLAKLPSCGHQICRLCIAQSVDKQMALMIECVGVERPLKCSVCSGQLPLDLLPWVLPLASANALSLLQYATVGHRKKQPLAQCPGCLCLSQAVPARGKSPEIGGKTETTIMSCVRCSMHWCAGCSGAPHWPLSCALNVKWSSRGSRPAAAIDETFFGHQVPDARSAKMGKGSAFVSGGSGQFAEICSEAHARRMDAKLGWQLGKHMRRLGGTRAERQFGLARKTALHLLEFGTAWLAMNRHNRPGGWSQLKTLLWALQNRLECLDNELLFSGSMTDQEALKAKLANLEELGEKVIQKMNAILAANAEKMTSSSE